MAINFNINDISKLPVTRFFATLAVAAIIILALPDRAIDFLHLSQLKKSGYVGLAFLISISIIAVTLLTAAYRWAQAKWRVQTLKQNRIKQLKGLDNFQKAIMYKLYLESNHTADLPVNDGAVHLLERYGMIGKTTNLCFLKHSNNLNPVSTYLLQPWVIECLNKHTDIQEDFRKQFEDYSSSP